MLSTILKNVFFYLIDFLQINRLFRYINRGKIKTLMYHSISEPGAHFNNAIDRQSLRNQIRHLKKHYNLLSATSLDQFESYSTQKVNILITFDDGFKDNHYAALNILRNEQVSGLFFIISGCIEQGTPPKFMKNKTFNSKDAAYRTLDILDISEMIASGMAIGSHSTNHDDYSVMNYQVGLSDAAESKMRIEKLTGTTIKDFSFPWGRYRSGQEIDLLKIYKRVFTTEHGFNNPDDRVIFRNEVFSELQLRAAASGSLDFFKSLFLLRSK